MEKDVVNYCQCGCGELAKPGNRFILGHSTTGRKYPKELYPNHGNRNKHTWNKDLTKETDERLKKAGEAISKAKKGKPRPHPPTCLCPFCKTKRGEMSSPNKGKRLSEERKKKMHLDNCQCCFCKSKRGELKGSNSFNWKGGTSFEPYGPEWMKLKKIIKERDSNQCKLCGSKVDLCVHHINYDKEDCRPENLTTLCRVCNVKVNYNREKWRKSFSKIGKFKLIYTAHSVKTHGRAKSIARYVLRLNRNLVPLNPFLCFPFDVVTKDQLKYDLTILSRCDEMWIFGEFDEGVLIEIEAAKKFGIMIKEIKMEEIVK